MSTPLHSEAFDAHLARWILRTVLETGAGRRVVKPAGVDEQLLRAVGLEGLAEQKLEPAALMRVLAERQQTLEAERPPRNALLFRNVRRLGAVLALTRTERELLVLVVAAQLSSPLHDCLEKLPAHTLPELAAAVATILRRPLREVLEALRSDAVLRSGRLIHLAEPERHRGLPFHPMDGLLTVLLSDRPSAEALVAPFFRPGAPAKLTLEDFSHLRDDLAVLRPLLRAALAKRARGVNVLLWGPPGTGKTELARLLARDLDAALYEVCDEDADGDPMRGAQRFAAYLLCQRVIRDRARALVLFDEVEDVFDVPRDERRPKAWTNRALEENPAPAIWVGNAIEEIDPAYLRRFDFVLELRAPPASVRERILSNRLSPFAPGEAWIRNVAADPRLTPAHADRVARVVSLALPESPEGASAETIAGRYLDHALALQGRAPARAPDLSEGARYDLRHVHASVDLERLLAALRTSPRGTICLYGPPGTGKTAYVQHLARALDRPLMLKRASDVLSCWVGGTERNLAEMFRDARREKAVLMLDEADSFLADRRGAERLWEVTQVNELLVQMEAFDGLFFCATNNFDALDAASLRRFALKVRFEVPRPEQRFALFVDTVHALGLALTDRERPMLRAQVDALHGITPGDFRTVLRQARLLRTLSSPAAVIDALAEELRARPESRRAHVGFHPARSERRAPELVPPAVRANDAP